MDKNITDIAEREVVQNVLEYKDLIIEGAKSPDTKVKTWSYYYMILFPLVFRSYITKVIEQGTKLEREYVAELIQNNLEQYKNELSLLAQDSEPDVRISALKSYSIDINLYKDAFLTALNAEDRVVKVLAMRYLSPFFDELKDTFLTLTASNDPEIAMTATSIVIDQRSIDTETVENLLHKANLNAKSLILRHMTGHYEKFKGAINTLLSSDDESVVHELVHRLNPHQFEELKEKLEELLMRPENYRLSSTILYKFGESPSKYKDSIIKVLSHENPQLRQSALYHIKSRSHEYRGLLSEIYLNSKPSLQEDLAGLFGEEVENFQDEAVMVLKSGNELVIKKLLLNLSHDIEEIHALLLQLLGDGEKGIKSLIIDYIAKHLDYFDKDMNAIISEIFSQLNKEEKINIFKSIAYHLK